MKKPKVKSLVLCGLFTALIGVGAFIKIPIPYVPISLQNFITTLAGLLLGAKLGAASVLIYIIIGLLGIPVFVNGGGISYIFNPTFGYLLGFILGAFITGKIAQNNQINFLRALTASLLGMGAVYVVGIPYFYIIANYFTNNSINFSRLLVVGFLSTLPGDLIKCLICAYLSTKLIPAIQKNI